MDVYYKLSKQDTVSILKLGGNVKSDVATGAKLRDKKPPVSEVSGRILRKRVEIKEKVPKKRKLEDLEDEPSVKVNFEDFKGKNSFMK